MPNPTLCCWCDAPASHVLIHSNIEGRRWDDPACPTHVAMYIGGYDKWDAISLV